MVRCAPLGGSSGGRTQAAGVSLREGITGSEIAHGRTPCRGRHQFPRKMHCRWRACSRHDLRERYRVAQLLEAPYVMTLHPRLVEPVKVVWPQIGIRHVVT